MPVGTVGHRSCNEEIHLQENREIDMHAGL